MRAKKMASSASRTSRFKKLFYTKYGRILLSCILGLGLATVFRRACRSGNCVVHKIPSRHDIQTKVYKDEGSCFKVSLHEAACEKGREDLMLQ